MENKLLEINRDLMTYEGKTNHSAKKQKVLTKPAWVLEERGHPGGGDEHSAVGALGLPGVSAGALLGQPLQPLLSVCSVRGWQVCPPEDLDFFSWLKWWWSTSWWKSWAWIRRKGKMLHEEGMAGKLPERNSFREALVDLNPAQNWSRHHL